MFGPISQKLLALNGCHFLACGVPFTIRRHEQSKAMNIDGFSFAVLERTLELVDDVMSPEGDPAVAAGVRTIRRCIESPGIQDRTVFHSALLQLARLAHEDRQFLIAARLEAFAREMDQTRHSHDVA